MTRGHRTLAAIMLTDAVGFSARMSVDEELTLNQIQRDQQLMQNLCQEYEGQVLKSTGDGLLMYFASAVQAMTCALEIQRQLHRMNAGIDADKVLLHRIGVHLGDVFFSQSDVMGTGVNIAARLQTEAYPGGICISQIVYDVVKSRLSLNAAYAGPLQLKNIQEPVPAYHIQPLEKPLVKPSDPLPPASSTTARDKLEPGSKVGGRYVVRRVLGQGGFGRSYLVEDSQRFGEACVLKEFFPANKSGRALQKAVDLFKREAKTLYQLDHPQVPKFLACFTQGQRLFLVQEYIDGVTYSQLLRERRQAGQQFSEQEVTHWLMQMLQVLHYLHQMNIIHRDISPDNIMYSRDRNLPILIDFGLVNDAVSHLLTHMPEDGEDSNRAATMVGKFGYSPPEQMHLGQCFPCSDLYALGVTAVVLLTAKYPRDLMDRNSLEWQWQSHTRLSDLLAGILNKLIQQKPKERFQSAQQVMAALSGLVQATTAPPPLLLPNPAGIDPFPASPADSTVRTLPSALQNAPFIEQCRQELTRCIGPIASVVLEDVIDQNPQATPQELVEKLAAQLSDGQQAVAFVSRIQMPADGVSAPSQEPAPLASPSGPTSAPLGNSAGGTRGVTPDFLERCRQALTRCVGPMASFILEETLTDYPNLDAPELVARLAAEIPDAQKAQDFQRQLL